MTTTNTKERYIAYVSCRYALANNEDLDGAISIRNAEAKEHAARANRLPALVDHCITEYKVGWANVVLFCEDGTIIKYPRWDVKGMAVEPCAPCSEEPTVYVKLHGDDFKRINCDEPEAEDDEPEAEADEAEADEAEA